MKEKRAFRRVNISIPIKYKAQHRKGESLSIDLSGGGVQFLADEEFPVGTGLELDICIPGCSEPIPARGMVVHSEKMAARIDLRTQYRTGVKFTKVGLLNKKKIIHYVYHKTLHI
jgi:c-di-GMP-binding flagellar brake protein YcgR